MMSDSQQSDASSSKISLIGPKFLGKAAQTPILLWRMGFGRLIGKALMIITHTGRISALPRHTVTQYQRIGGSYYVPVALGEKAQWYQNLMADPLVTLQLDGAPIYARARRVTEGEEIADLYALLLRRYPEITTAFLEEIGISEGTREEIIAHRDQLVAIAFDPHQTPGPPPVMKDLNWIPPLLGLFAFLTLLLSRRKRREAGR